jgi:lipoprotein-anchoring transpeptidase ErfK/SrfK
MTSDSIYPGASLKVPTQALSVYVKKSKFRLDVMLGNVLLRRYAVGIGRDNKSPEGKFTIATRLKDPHWFKPGGAAGGLPPEHPENILGTRWLGFAAKDGFPEAATFGIHGTKEDQTIGTESSNGCVRMHNTEVEELFEWVPVGTPVEIVP